MKVYVHGGFWYWWIHGWVSGAVSKGGSSSRKINFLLRKEEFWCLACDIALESVWEAFSLELSVFVDTGLGVRFVVLCCCRDPGECLSPVCCCRDPGDCLSLRCWCVGEPDQPPSGESHVKGFVHAGFWCAWICSQKEDRAHEESIELTKRELLAANTGFWCLA